MKRLNSINGTWIFLLSLVFFFSCNREETEDSLAEEIKVDWILDQNGDTIKTGVPFIVQFSKINTDTLLPVQHSTLTEDQVVPRQTNYFQAGIPNIVQAGKAIIEDVVIHDSTIYEIEEKITAAIHPQPTKAGQSRYRDNTFGELHYWDVDQGLSSSYGIGIYADSRGYLWIPTYVGFSRFDGRNFLHYSEDNGVPSRVVNDVTEDSDHNMWFGSNDGVFKYDGHNFYQIEFDTITNINQVATLGMEFDSEGRLWFVSRNRIYNYKNGIVTDFSRATGIKSRSLSIDSKDGIWLNLYDELICYRQGKLHKWGQSKVLMQ